MQTEIGGVHRERQCALVTHHTFRNGQTFCAGSGFNDHEMGPKCSLA